MTNKEIRKQLAERSRRELERAVEAVLTQPGSAAAESSLARLDRYRRLLDHLPSATLPERTVSLAIFCLSLAVLAVLWPWRLREVDFAAEVQAVEVGLRPAAPLVLAGAVEGQSARLSGMSWIDPSPAGPPIESARALAGFAVPGNRIQLERLTIEHASSLVVRRLGGNLELVIHDARLEGLLSYVPPGAAAGDFETVRFERHIADVVPASLFFAGAKLAPLADLRVEGIDFLRQQGEASTPANPYRSSIVAGKVRVLPVDGQHTLYRGDHLRLGEVIQPKRLDFEWQPKETLAVRVAGRTDRLEAGPEGFVRDLRPSRLEVLSKEPKLGLLWAGLIFVSGVLWNIRKILPI